MSIPSGAVYLYPADSFAELQAMHENRPDKRQYLRVAFNFVIIWFEGVMLVDVGPRRIGIRKRTWREGRVLLYNREGQVPGIHVWTLAQERAA